MAGGRTRSIGEGADNRISGRGGQSTWTHWTAAFVQRLNELGWIQGRTVTIEYRWAEGRTERFREIAAERRILSSSKG